MSEYCHGLDEKRIVYRLRCARGDLERVTLSYGDTACRVTPIIFTTLEMELAASDEYHDYWEICVESEYNRVYYYFTLYGRDGEWTHYYGGELTRTLVDERSEYFKLPYNHRADIAAVPDWARDALVYNIFPDSFASADGSVPGEGRELDYRGEASRSRLGGTLDGVAAKGRLHKGAWLQLRIPKPHLCRRRIPQVRTRSTICTQTPASAATRPSGVWSARCTARGCGS